MKAHLFGGSAVAVTAGCIFTAMLAYACLADIRSRRIPNPLVGYLALAGIAYSTAVGVPPGRAFLVSMAGLLVGLLLWLPFYAMHWLGAGDVKLFGAAGAWLGPLRAAEGALVAALVGGVFALAWMLRAYGLQGTAASASLALASPRSVANHRVDRNHSRALPYGVALSLGAVLVAWFPSMLEAFHGR